MSPYSKVLSGNGRLCLTQTSFDYEESRQLLLTMNLRAHEGLLDISLVRSCQRLPYSFQPFYKRIPY